MTNCQYVPGDFETKLDLLSVTLGLSIVVFIGRPASLSSSLKPVKVIMSIPRIETRDYVKH